MMERWAVVFAIDVCLVCTSSPPAQLSSLVFPGAAFCGLVSFFLVHQQCNRNASENPHPDHRSEELP